MNLPSKYLEQAVDAMASLPGIGRRTALRLVLSMLNRKPEDIKGFTNAFNQLVDNVKFCEKCFNLSDHKICNICSNPNRNESIICVVRDVRDVMAIENTLQYKGVYHVLGGVISPMDGIGPSDLRIEELIIRLKEAHTEEVILALGATMEGDTTNFFLYKKIESLVKKVSILSRGVSVGDELEFADEATLGRSITNRLPFESTLGAD